MADAIVYNMIMNEIMDDDADEYNPGTRHSVIKSCILSTLLRSDRIKIHDYVDEIVGKYLVADFKKLFRVSPQTHQNLCGYMAGIPDMKEPLLPSGRPPVPLEKKVLVGLWYLGNQDSLKQISDRFNITESCVVNCRNAFLSATSNGLRRQFIVWPNNTEREEISQKFQAKNGFPDIVGAIDATHIEIQAPEQTDKQVYINRKGFHSLNVQAVCRENMLFTHCYIGWPGSVHDSRILRNSELWEFGLGMCADKHLIGDGGYPTRSWLLTPYRNNGALTRQQKHFNYLLSSNRSVIERAFGLLKRRFKRLSFVNVKSTKTRLEVIMSCFVLHNICIIGEDNFDDMATLEQDANDAVENIGHLEDEAEGMLKRDQLAHQLYH